MHTYQVHIIDFHGDDSWEIKAYDEETAAELAVDRYDADDRLVARGSSVDVVVTLGPRRWEFTVSGETLPTYRARKREC